MKKLIIIIFSISVLSGYSQDISFSQYNNSRLNTNPAFTGSDSTLVLSANYRLQWPNISATFQTVNCSVDKYVHFLRAGLGLNYLYVSEAHGLYTKSRIDFNYAPHFELFKHKLAIQTALQISYFQNTIDWSKLTYGDMIDPRRGFVYNTNEVPGNSTKSNIDLSTGILLYGRSFFAGIAVHHLTQPEEGLMGPSALPLKTTIHGGINLKFKNDSTGKFILSPTLLFMKQQDFQILMPGITAKYKFISLGVSYRNSDSFIATLAFQNKYVRIGYSYDCTVSKLTNSATGGAHEIGFSCFLKSKKKNCKIKTLRLI